MRIEAGAKPSSRSSSEAKASRRANIASTSAGVSLSIGVILDWI